MELSVQSDATAAYTPGKYPGTHCIGGSVHPSTGPDVWEKRLSLFTPYLEP